MLKTEHLETNPLRGITRLASVKRERIRRAADKLLALLESSRQDISSIELDTIVRELTTKLEPFRGLDEETPNV